MSDEQQQALVARYRPRTEHELAALKFLQQRTEADRAPVALDQQSVGWLLRMKALQGQAMAGASGRRVPARLDEGEYGFCAECGGPIASGRPGAGPSHHLCVHCAAQRE